MLSITNRHLAETLLDAAVLSSREDSQDAIIFVETGRPDVHVSRRAFLRESLIRAGRLKSLGIGRGDLVVIAHTQNLESIFAFWGALLAGAMPSMFPTLTEKLDPEVYMSSMAELVKLSEVRAVLTTDEFAPQLAGVVECEVIGSSPFSSPLDDNPTNIMSIAEPDDIAFLQHSSGTTGLQKGVALSHRSVLNQITSYSEAIALRSDDVVVSWLPLYHDMGLIAGFVLPLFQGIPLVLMSPFDWVQHPALLLRAIYEHQGTLCWLPNFAYNHCARRIRERDLEQLSLSSMRMFINCSEPVYQESHDLFLERFQRLGLRPEMLAVSYAMAENTFGVTQTRPGKAPKLDIINPEQLQLRKTAIPAEPGDSGSETRVSCGEPIQGTRIIIIDTDGMELPARRVGEICVQSDCMLSGYYRRPDLQPFQDGWFRTGDTGYIAHGELFVVGRSKDLIINGGKNIYPQDIEAIVNEVKGVHAGRAVAFGVPDTREGTELIAVVAEVATSDPAERKVIKTSIRQKVVSQSMITVSYVYLVEPRWLIKTSSGKIARSANREKWLAETRTTAGM